MRIRPEKVAHLMRREVADILERRLRDPRVTARVSVTDVEITHDLAFARIFVMVSGEPAERDMTMEGLQRAAGFVRHELGDRMGLREVPEIRFVYDDSLDRGARVDDLLRRIEKGEIVDDEDKG
ncbi:MAG: 30S ribosome-binding factor RbfA [Candidatus Eisenbacteria bacterium]